MPQWSVNTLRRVAFAIAVIGVSATAARPSIAATNDHSVLWTSLGVIRPVLTQPSAWGSPIAAQPTRATFGWCTPSGVEITSGEGRPVFVSDVAVGPMLEHAHLTLSGLSKALRASPTCGDLALDPTHPRTIYAGFLAAQGGLIPPSYDVAVVTTNQGKSWRFVPPPKGFTRTDFAGFVERSSGVELLYALNYFFPLKPGQSAAFVEATSSTGGRTWADGHLHCPAGTPCVIFGPESPQGACGMSQWHQSVLVGATYEYRGTTRWRAAGAVNSVSECNNQQLVDTASGDEFLVDRSRPNALLYTRDGIHWIKVILPKIDEATVGGSVAPVGQIMTLAADGALIAVSGSPLATTEHLELLKPGSTKWCATSADLSSTTGPDFVTAIQSSKSTLVVSFETAVSVGRGTKATALTFPLSMLQCRK